MVHQKDESGFELAGKSVELIWTGLFAMFVPTMLVLLTIIGTGKAPAQTNSEDRSRCEQAATPGLPVPAAIWAG
jgi:hypothetical protein